MNEKDVDMAQTHERRERNQKEEMSGVEQAIQIAGIACDVVVLLFKFVYFFFESIYRKFVPAVEESVKGEVVLVTGAGHGIGKQLATQYASHGATVVCWDINAENNAATVADIAKKGYPKAYSYSCDVSNRQAVFDTVAKVKKDVGDITIIVNNAGIMPTHRLLDHTQQEIERIFGINVLAHFWIIQAILPSMIKNKHGHIVNISSCAGLFGLENLVPYCASKFAVVGLSEALYQELKLYPGCNVKTTVICPYMVDTGLCKNPVMRFKSTMQMETPEAVAAAVISAQRRGEKAITVPDWYFYLSTTVRTWPMNSADALKDFLGARLESDLH